MLERHLTALNTLQIAIMSSIRHPNVVLFMGLCLEPPCMVSEFCARGSLYDVLKRARAKPALGQQLDWPKRLNMLLDAAKVGCCMKWICPVQAVVKAIVKLAHVPELLAGRCPGFCFATSKAR